jgi:DNA-binding IclR family transcriptional regulator
MDNFRSVPAVTRAIAILRLLGRSPAPQGINQIARELGLVPSTCLHILRVLAGEDLVALDPETKRYTLGVGLLSMARSVIARNDFAALAQPRLTALSDRFAMTAIAVQMTGRSMTVVALSQASLPFRLQVDLGSRFPALISASGRCVAAFNSLSDTELREGFASLKWDNPPSFEDWMEQVEATRRNGYGIDRENYIAGVTILAAPIFDRFGKVSHAIVAAGISDRHAAQDSGVVADAMLDYRDEIGELSLGSPPAGAKPKRGVA